MSPSNPPSQSSNTGKPPSASSSSSSNGGEKKPSSSSSSPLLLLCLALQQIQEGVSQQDERPIIRMFRQLKRLRASCQTRHLQLAANHLLWGADLSSSSPPSSSSSSAGAKSTGDSSTTTTGSKREDEDEKAEDKEGQRNHLNGTAGGGSGGGDSPVCVTEEKKVQYRQREIDGDTAAFWNFLKHEMERMLQESKKDQMQVDGAADKEKVSRRSHEILLSSSFFSPCRTGRLLREFQRRQSFVACGEASTRRLANKVTEIHT